MSYKELEFSKVELHGQDFYEKLLKAHVTIFGLGGLGSNVAALLTRAGIGSLTLIDYDEVEYSNLNRQHYFYQQVGKLKTDALAENLKLINPQLKLTMICEKIGQTNIVKYLPKVGIVVEAFDQAESKALLVNGVLSCGDLVVVSASGMGGTGPANRIQTKKINDHFYLIGDDEAIPEEGCRLMGPRVMVAASHQATQVIRLILDELED